MPTDYYRKLGTVELRFEWTGGPYITVHEKGFSGVEVINVWDYVARKPTIPVTNAGLRQAADEWVETYGDQETPLACMAALEHDVINHWRLIQQPNRKGGRVGMPRLPRSRPTHTHPTDFRLSSGHLHDEHADAFAKAGRAGVSPKTWHEREHSR